MNEILFFILVCLVALFFLMWALRWDRISLGLPFAYLASLLLIHVPGALVHIGDDGSLYEATLSGIRLTAIGSVFFVIGVCLTFRTARGEVFSTPVDCNKFYLFCLIGGWGLLYAVNPIIGRIPSLSAIVDLGAAIWILGVMLGLRDASQHGNAIRLIGWLMALAVFPSLMLLFGGFLGYGAAAVIAVMSILIIATRKAWKVIFGIILISYLGMSIFVNYFHARGNLRHLVWGGAPMELVLDAVNGVIQNFEWFDPTNRLHLGALDERFNQNLFVGLSAMRIDQDIHPYLYGGSITETFIAIIPRAIWPDKPVVAGSPKIVSEMTGLRLSQTTSFGVGNVMEFYINYGLPSLMLGFLLLGWLIGILDRKAALAVARGDLGSSVLYFLPAVALIQPGGSMVEMSGGAGAALIAAQGWKWAWNIYRRNANTTERQLTPLRN